MIIYGICFACNTVGFLDRNPSTGDHEGCSNIHNPLWKLCPKTRGAAPAFVGTSTIALIPLTTSPSEKDTTNEAGV